MPFIDRLLGRTPGDGGDARIELAQRRGLARAPLPARADTPSPPPPPPAPDHKPALPTSFGATFLAKVSQRPSDVITELRRPEVIAELLLVAAPFAAAWALRRRAWRTRSFYCTLNVSLNSFCPSTRRFTFRTVREESAHAMLPPGGADDLIAAARLASAADSFIVPLASGPRWVINNAVLNRLSEQFAGGTLTRDVLGPAGPSAVRCAPYVLCLTAEPAGVARESKVRAMLARRDALLALATAPPPFGGDAGVLLDAPWQLQRFDLVCELARKWSVGAQLSRAEETALPHAVQAARAAARKAFSPPRSDDTHTQREDSPFVTFELCVPL